MKSLLFLSLLLVSCLLSPLLAQEFKEDIRKELSFGSSSSDNQLHVHNIFGSITVEAYGGNTVQVEAERNISGPNQQVLQQGKDEVKLKFAEKGNDIYVYVETPNSLFDLAEGQYQNHRFNSNNYVKKDYRYLIDIHVKVPKTTNLKLRAINNGDISVENVQAKTLDISNINGGITLTNIAGKTRANALNKDINISYASNPVSESSYQSLNGDITVLVNGNLDADVSFKTLNGGFYTNFEASSLTPKMTQTEVKNSRGVKYKINKDELFRIGKGGVELHFDVLNGDVTLKK